MGAWGLGGSRRCEGRRRRPRHPRKDGTGGGINRPTGEARCTADGRGTAGHCRALHGTARHCRTLSGLPLGHADPLCRISSQRRRLPPPLHPVCTSGCCRFSASCCSQRFVSAKRSYFISLPLLRCGFCGDVRLYIDSPIVLSVGVLVPHRFHAVSHNLERIEWNLWDRVCGPCPRLRQSLHHCAACLLSLPHCFCDPN